VEPSQAVTSQASEINHEYVSDASSIMHAPSSMVALSETESVLHRNLHFLARELELEKKHREKLQCDLQEIR
jgi:hypothetical protein